MHSSFLSRLSCGSLLFASCRLTSTVAFSVATPTALLHRVSLTANHCHHNWLLGRHRLYSSSSILRSVLDSTTSSTEESLNSEDTSTASTSRYSTATQQRIQGLDPHLELAQWATKLGTSVPRLTEMLQQKLAESTDRTSEKAEYMDWIVSETTGGGAANGSSSSKSKNQRKRNNKKKKNDAPKNTSSNNNNTSNSQNNVASAAAAASSSSKQQTFQTDVHFRDANLHPLSKRALTETMGFSSMTEIQAKTLEAASSGQDVLGRARTGTGKTVAFLLPAIERVLQMKQHLNGVGILVVSPTRELATQIADQAEKLTQFHKGFSVQVVFGGTNMKSDVNRLQKRLPTILVATPGRLLDHMQSTIIHGKSVGRDIMSQTPIVVLDETDRLLDMGFQRDVQKILGYLPSSRDRQTLLFSATIPPELKTIMAQNMKPDFVEVDCINDGDAATHTNEQVRQSHIVLKEDRQVSAVVEIVSLALHQDADAKIVVFFPTAKLVNFYAEVFNQNKLLPSVLELHSRKTQSYRNRVSDEFRAAHKGILFTSDVSARGVDYPNVSHVIQFGIPESREQYIHRLGRTGRGGTAGRGWLVLSEWESNFLSELKGVEIPVDTELESLLNNPITSENEELVNEARRLVRGGHAVLNASARGAYQAFLGYYKGQMKRIKLGEAARLVEIANSFAAQAGLHEPPFLTPRLVGKMGLKGVPGLRIQKEEPHGGRNGNGNNNNNNNNNNNQRRSGGGGSPKRPASGKSSGGGPPFKGKRRKPTK